MEKTLETRPLRAERAAAQGRQLEFVVVEGAETGAELVIAERQEQPERGPDGKFLPGNQCARHTLTGEQREALEEVRKLAPKVAEKMSAMLDDETVPATAKIRIMETILDRTYGKPEAAVRLNADIASGEASRARLDAIAERIRREIEG